MARKRTPSKSRADKNRLKVLSSKVVYNGKVFKVTSDKITEPTGITARRDVVRHAGSVVVLAVDESGGEPRVLLENSIATRRAIICGNCQPAASIQARRRWLRASASCWKRPVIARDNGSAPCISTPAPAFSTRR